jgi:hypothetical protein
MALYERGAAEHKEIQVLLTPTTQQCYASLNYWQLSYSTLNDKLVQRSVIKMLCVCTTV